MGLARQGKRAVRRKKLSEVKDHKRAVYRILEELDRIYDKMIDDGTVAKLQEIIRESGDEEDIAGPTLDYVDSNSDVQIGEMELYYLIQKIMSYDENEER